MTRILHIIATPRGTDSFTLQLSRHFLEQLASHVDIQVETLDLWTTTLPPVDGSASYELVAGNDISQHADAVQAYIAPVLAAEMLVVSAPLWNFSAPYVLKHYIDVVVQPTYLFDVADDGTIIGKLTDKTAVLIATSGSDFRQPSLTNSDHLTGWFRAVWEFCGIPAERIHSVLVGPTAMGDDLRDEALQRGEIIVTELAAQLANRR